MMHSCAQRSHLSTVCKALRNMQEEERRTKIIHMDNLGLRLTLQEDAEAAFFPASVLANTARILKTACPDDVYYINDPPRTPNGVYLSS